MKDKGDPTPGMVTITEKTFDGLLADREKLKELKALNTKLVEALTLAKKYVAAIKITGKGPYSIDMRLQLRGLLNVMRAALKGAKS